ncbi:glycosyltransferase [Nocardioides sp. Kera G14]|uniref:glycosyltransferase n=1 Tax=Nocardioides sp. Kera G14 TaxID=2884264 RepID=UPI001D1208BB|nr:glycosyltransferase family 4 protein [Nocardioides sp. Kera G14]UDY24983.1 glycosyltransferase family 4 protein [Nocardioides sp. Kera G14]
MRILLWHVHGSWTTSFVQGRHDYLLPVTPDRGPDGLGRARTWDWPTSVREVPSEELASEPVDLVVLQRPHELELAARWLGRRPGEDVPAVYVEHNTPMGDVPDTRHPLADQRAIPIAHVTGFNDLMWDAGEARTVVIDHGIVDPGLRYTGELDHAAVVVNDPVRRGRSVGADLVPVLADAVPVDLFGMRVDQMPQQAGLTTYEDLPQEQMHSELARRRVYAHLSRWTSLGLSLLEAMHLGMPVVAMAATEAPRAVVPGTGELVTSPAALVEAVRRLVDDPERATETGRAARQHVLERYGLKRFLDDWDAVLEEAAR